MQLTSKSVQALFAAIGLKDYGERPEANTTTRVGNEQLEELAPLRKVAKLLSGLAILNTQA